MRNHKHILVLGVGSVGKRHLNNLLKMGCSLSAMDPNISRLEEVKEEITLTNQYLTLESIEPDWQQFDGVVICSPPKFHREQCVLSARHGLPILLEKPLVKNFGEALELQNDLSKIKNVKLLLGYTYRWWKPLQDFKKKLQDNQVGKPLHAKFVMSAHLADWHPWERYQDFFMASKDLGGGALLDESHFVDLMFWFFGMPNSLYAQVEKLSNLDIETDDNVDILFSYPDGLRISIHLDLFGRPHEKYIVVTGEGRTIQWSFDPNQLSYSESMEQQWDRQGYKMERNDMFVDVAREFLQIIDGADEFGCSLDEGVQVMRILEACKLSSREGRRVQLAELID